jgi:hypothetical protein
MPGERKTKDVAISWKTPGPSRKEVRKCEKKKKKKKLCLQMYEGHTEETEKQFQIGVEKVQAPFNLLHHLPSKN